VGLRFTAVFMRVSLSNFEASFETVGAKVCTMLASLLCSKSALPFEDSREGLSSAYLSNLVEEEFYEVRGYKRASIWAPRLPLAPHTIPARPV
jgi:hypothetical protein